MKEYELLSPGVTLQNQGDRFFTPPWGLDGGLPATTQAYFLTRDGRRKLPSRPASWGGAWRRDRGG